MRYLGNYIYENSEATDEYPVGFYFSDEVESLNGPFGTIEEATNALNRYIEEINPHLF